MLAVAVCPFIQISVGMADGLSEKPTIDISLSQDKGSELRFETRRAPLAQVLVKLSEITGMQIHYSVLPEGNVTATCVGSGAKQLLECLLATKSDLVFRYPKKPGRQAAYQPTEAWILGAKYTTDLTPVVEVCLSRPEPMPEQAAISDRTDELVVKARSKDPAVRASAIGELISEGRPGDPSVREVLEEALNDKDANVRAQAISTYATREGEKAFGALQEALQDSNAWVRQMAVESTDDTALLQQAMNDSEEPVRSLALQKLKSQEARPENSQ